MQIYTILALCSAITVLAVVVRANPVDPILNIIGGEDVMDGNRPYQVALYLNDAFYCGGTLIGRRTVLTAGQCIYRHENNPSLFKIRYGSLSHAKGHQVAVAAILKHPRFTVEQLEYDLAVLYLESPVELSKNAYPIQLADRPPALGSHVAISGWGKLAAEGDHFPQTLQIAKSMRVVSTEYCQRKWHPIVKITNGILCAESERETQSACKFDAGSPVTQKGLLVGIISFGPKRCLEPGIPNGYADIAHHRQWILEHIGD